MVEGLRVGVTRRRKGVDRHGGLVPLVGRRTVRRAGVVEEVAALERYLVAFAPRVGVVHAEGVDRRHAALGPHHVLAHAVASARVARHAEDVLEGEVLLVDVVEEPDDRDAAVAVEDVDVAARDVLEAVFGPGVGIVAESGIELAELSLTHVLARHDVDGLVALAVVHARELGRVAQLVVDLYPFDGLCRQRLDGRGDVIAEELLAVDEDLLDLFALGLDRTVGHRDARHLFEQPLDVGIVRHLEGSGVVAHRVAALRRAQGLDLLDDGFDLHAGLELQHAEVLPRRVHRKGEGQLVVAQKGHRQRVASVGQLRKRYDALVGRGHVELLVGVLVGNHCYHGADHALPRIGIDHRRGNGARLCEGGGSEERQQGC